MMMFRMINLRRRTDPKTGSHTLREPAQSKCTSTFHKSHFMRQQTEVQTLCEPAESKCTTYRTEISRKNAAPSVSVRDKQFVRATRPGVQTLCEPAQPTCTSTCHRSNFLLSLQKKRGQLEHPDQAPVFTITDHYSEGPLSVDTLCGGKNANSPEATNLGGGRSGCRPASGHSTCLLKTTHSQEPL